MNSLVLSQFLLNGSKLAAFAIQIGLCEVWMGILAWGFVMITCATADTVANW